MGVCDWGILGDVYCIFLIDNGDDTTSCQLLLDKKIPPGDIAIGKGCIMKHFPEYDYYKRQFDEWRPNAVKRQPKK